MSWEESSRTTKRCPCGLGTYTITVLSDDWGRSEERWQMDCPSCSRNYRLHTHYYIDSGMYCGSYLWIPKESLERLNGIEAELAAAKETALQLAKDRYLAKWLGSFRDAKTKKDAWRRLTAAGKRYPSLSTFYSHLKHQSLEEYLKDAFRFDALPSILGSLSIVDPDVNAALATAEGLSHNLEAFEALLLRQGYR